MNQKDGYRSSESDPVVSAAYRAGATERTPPELDARVLDGARGATADTGLRRFSAFWFRPVAFVATLGLSLALILELTDTVKEPSLTAIDAGSSRQEAESIESTPTTVVPRTDTSAGTKQAVESPDPSGDSANSGRTSADFADMIEAGSKQMREAESVSNAAFQGLAQSAEPSAVVSNHETRPCPDTDNAEPSVWWECISALQEAGKQDEADFEMELFRAAYPDFEPPTSFPSQ
jgi:hypothetical protein